MNYWWILGILLALVVLERLRVPFIFWLFIWPAAVYLFLNFGIIVPVPASVQELYLWLTVGAVVVYLFADKILVEEVRGQLVEFVINKRYRPFLNGLVILLPILLATKVYFGVHKQVRVPTFGRTIHPAPPGSIDFKGRNVNLLSEGNPYRELERTDPKKFKEHLESGRTVYYQNCVYCHGDDMGGDGIFAHGLDPLPANFNSETTISQLQEAYLFWRIAKGAPGLPPESGPWSSSMPAWEKFLTEKEIWDVILYLYHHTGLSPRAEEEVH